MSTDHRAVGASTIVARNYLPAARVLADTYRVHHPDTTFTVLVVDAVEGELDDAKGDPGIRFFTANDLDLDPDDFSRMAVSYTAAELCTAVKPWLLRRLLTEYDVALYLDPDIEVFAAIADEIHDLAAEHGIVLTPHVLAPIPRDGLRPSETDIMFSGVFNLGFIAVSLAAEPFLRSWSTRLRQGAIVSVEEQLFFDQRWVDNVPAMYDHYVINDPGYNVAYWNVYQRALQRHPDGTITAGGSPLRFLHYSGYRPETPWLLSIHYADNPRVLLSEHPVLRDLVGRYRTKLLDAGYPETVDTVQYRWAKLPDGTSLSLALRRAFRESWLEAERSGERPPRGPFGPGGAADFLAWATAPGNAEQESAGLNRWAMAVWRGRADLQAHFPDPYGASAAAFRDWCATSGVVEGELPVGVMPDRRHAEPVDVRSGLGVNLLGYLTTESGVGELGRLVHEAIHASGVPLATTIDEATVINRTGHVLTEDPNLRDPEFGVSVVVVNADMTPTAEMLNPEFFRDRYVIGVWSWELSEFPATMHAAFAHVDEVWANSDFTAEAIRKHSPVPVFTFPIPARDPLRAEIPVHPPDGKTRFLFVFDHNSLFYRKNPTGTITAFQHAFQGRDDVALIIKAINGDRHPSDRERLRAAVNDDPRIELIEQYLDSDEMRKLFAGADCYVSLHRSEGYGFTVAEAMAHGLPVIATDYSSTRELLRADSGWAVPYELVPVGHGSPPYPPDAVWAEPDIDAAVEALREVAANPALARRRGEAARKHVLASRPVQATARWVRERLEAAYERWTSEGGPRGASTGRLAPVRDALHAQPDINSPSRVPLARTMRRMVLRALDHHDNHQRQVLDTFIDIVESTVGQLTDRLEGLEQRLASTSARLAAIQHERDQLAAASVQRVDAASRKLTELIRRSDQRADHTEAAIGDLTAELGNQLPALHAGLIRLHDLLRPPPTGDAEPVNTRVGLLRLPADDSVMLPWLRTYGRWEDNESQLIDLLLPTGGVFVDIGAHIGWFTICALQKVGADGLVVAVEPWAEARELLEHNVSANLPDAVARALTVLPVAAWDSPGPLRMSVGLDGNTGDNRITADGTVEVEGVRLDETPPLAGRRVDVVKCDAQGRDQYALAGMTSLFDIHKPHILCEFDPTAIAEAGGDPAAVLATYRSWDYVPVPITDELVQRAAAAVERVDAGLARTDEELIEQANLARDGFVTLWLRPAQAATSA